MIAAKEVVVERYKNSRGTKMWVPGTLCPAHKICELCLICGFKFGSSSAAKLVRTKLGLSVAKHKQARWALLGFSSAFSLNNAIN